MDCWLKSRKETFANRSRGPFSEYNSLYGSRNIFVEKVKFPLFLSRWYSTLYKEKSGDCT